jgi:dihydroxyacetone kinase
VAITLPSLLNACLKRARWGYHARQAGEMRVGPVSHGEAGVSMEPFQRCFDCTATVV